MPEMGKGDMPEADEACFIRWHDGYIVTAQAEAFFGAFSGLPCY